MKNEEDSFDEFISSTPKEKRSRSSNFTSQEEDVLMSLVEKFAHIVENKTTNAVSWQKKNEAWEKISLEFGSQCGIVRSSKNLRDKYENMKRKAKIAISNDRNEFYKTGGGSYKSKVSDKDKRVNALLGKSTTGLHNQFDCDMSEKQNEDSLIEVEFLEDGFSGNLELTDPIPQCAEKTFNKSNTWNNWNPSKLKTKKAEKLNFKNRVITDKDEGALAKQAIFFENEEKRAEERHKLQVTELNLKKELLELEIVLKKLEIEKFS